MTAEARLEIRLEGRDEASAAVRSLTESMARLERQAKALGAVLGGSVGAELSRQLDGLNARAKALGTGMGEASEKVAQALRSDTTAARELRDALREVADAQRSVARGVRMPASARSASIRSTSTSPRDAAQRAAAAERDAFAGWRTRQRIKTRSEAIERRDAERERRATASAAAAQLRAEQDALSLKLRNGRYLMGVRQRSEAAELRHVASIRRERDAMRRHAVSAGRHAYGHARHAARSLNHPVHESIGFALTAGAAFGVAAAEHIVRASEAFDSSVSRLRMFAPQLDADAVRRQALTDSITLGVSADKIVDSIAKSVRDGVPPAIAESLPKSIAQTAQVMGGDIERLTDSLAEGIQESTSMGWIKDKLDARRFLNLEAGLSTTAGNTSEKTEQFIAAGGLGHGKEMGLNLEKTMAFGAMLNASGARTGQASARFMGQLSQNIPKMFDYYRSAVQSHKNTEEDRVVRSAPSKLGYGSIREMQKRLEEGPEGVLDFATRLQKLDDKSRKLILQGFHFSEQGGAMLAELGSNGGAKGRVVLARAHELAEQKEAHDYLTQKFAEWSKSLSFMLQQIEAGWRAIENEVGDVIKTDIIAPLRDWWVLLSQEVVNSDLKTRLHSTIAAFVHGLGFDDVRDMLDAMTRNVHGFDVAGFARGVGEGIRATADALKSLGSVFGGTSGLSAETVGRIATEMLGLSLSLRFVSPVVNTIAGFASAILAVKAAVEFGQWVTKLVGVSEGLGAVAALDLAGAAAALATFAGSLAVLIGAAKLASDQGMLQPPKSWDMRGFLNFLDPNFGDMFLGKEKDKAAALAPKPVPALPSAPPPGSTVDEGFNGLGPMSYHGGGANWRDLIMPAAYVTEDASAGDRDRVTAAAIGTQRAVQRLADLFESRGVAAGLSTIGGSSGAGEGGGAGGGSAAMSGANRYMRWAGHGVGDNLGNSSTPARGALAANQREAFTAARAAGLSETAARALVANMSGESLASPGNYHWDRRHMSGGIVQWDPQRASAIRAKFGKNPWEMSVAEQTKAAVWEIQTNPRFAATARALQGDDSGAMIGALVKNYESPANPGAAIMRRMGYFRGFNPNAAAGGGAGEAAGELHLAGRVLGEQCVDLARAAVGATGSVREWRKGVSAEVGNLVPGTPVATFLDRMGRETDRYAGGGTGTPGAHLDHAGIFRKYVLDGAGKRIGMQIAEQYAGSHGVHLKDYLFGQGWGEGNGSNYHAILGQDGKPLGGDRNPLAKLPTPAGLADGARALPKGSTPDPHHAPVPHASGQSAQAAPVTIHAPIHVHGITDPHHVARVVGEHMEAKLRSRYSDVVV